MSTRQSYARVFDAIGDYIVVTRATDVLITELAEGYLLTCLVAHRQQALTFDGAALAHRCAEADRHRDRDSRDQVRARLRAVGRYLDERIAHAVVAQERVGGYVVEFTGWLPQARTSDLRGLNRLTEQLDDRWLLTLAA